MVSASEHGERTLHAISPVRNVFAALFLASIGLLLNPRFLWTHRAALLSCLALVVGCKAALTALVVRAFGYPARTSLVVGISLAQIGEFSFVLLARASALELVRRPAYLLLLGTTALSLLSATFMAVYMPGDAAFLVAALAKARSLPRGDDEGVIDLTVEDAPEEDASEEEAPEEAPVVIVIDDDESDDDDVIILD